MKKLTDTGRGIDRFFFFRGTWTFFPDRIDLHRYQVVNVYEDDNAFTVPGFQYMVPERPMMRTAEGQVTQTMRQMSQLEAALGSMVGRRSSMRPGKRCTVRWAMTDIPSRCSTK